MSEMRLPVVPVRDVVGYPHQIFPVLVGRPRSLAAVQDAMVSSRHILLLAQKDPELDNVKRALIREGLLGVTMTGSGSAFYGLCERKEVAGEIRNKLAASGAGVVYACESTRQ